MAAAAAVERHLLVGELLQAELDLLIHQPQLTVQLLPAHSDEDLGAGLNCVWVRSTHMLQPQTSAAATD